MSAEHASEDRKLSLRRFPLYFCVRNLAGNNASKGNGPRELVEIVGATDGDATAAVSVADDDDPEEATGCETVGRYRRG